MCAQRHPLSAVGLSLPPELLANALTVIANPVFIADRRGYIVWVNDAFCRISGYSPDEIIGKSPRILKSGKQDAAFYRQLWETILAGNTWHGEVAQRRKDGSLFTVEEAISPLRDDTGAITHYVAIHHDVTRRKNEVERERYLAYHDTLTDLPNRAMFFDVLKQALAKSGRTANSLALLYVDVDNFKSINDTLGHHSGDRLLRAVADRLRAAVRKHDTVARLGGDEFAVLQTDLDHPEIADALAAKVLDTISQPFMIDGHTVHVSVSIGIAIHPGDGDSPPDLLGNADRAMYQAKNHGRNNYRRHCPMTPRLLVSVQECHTKNTVEPTSSRQDRARRFPRAASRRRCTNDHRLDGENDA
ncbi:MAG: sensor domain-containing diguanylate cyclase [Gammaproteobacteria bacterium]|nr:sensor domain-containing diguanylate cyclase [Gammaproteobacteria bacterium]